MHGSDIKNIHEQKDDPVSEREMIVSLFFASAAPLRKRKGMVFAFLAYGPYGWELAIYLCAAFVSGICIGATGIGGVALTPLLLACRVPVHIAGAAVVGSLFLSGVTAIASNWQTLPRRRACTICLAALPSALVASLLFPLIPPLATGGLVSSISVVSGIHVLCTSVRAKQKAVASQDRASTAPSSESETWTAEIAAVSDVAFRDGSIAEIAPVGRQSYRRLDAGLGLLAGFFSVMTCTGGPFILLPLLFTTDPSLPPVLAIAIAQTLMLPISVCRIGVGGLSTASVFDLGLAMAIGSAVALGVPGGVRLSRRMDPIRLKNLVALGLLASGVLALHRMIRDQEPINRTTT